MNSQDLKKHRWEQRLLLILAEDKTDDNFQKQLQIFKEAGKDLDERKLLVYQVLPKAFKIGLDSDSVNWQASEKFYNNYNESIKNFEIVLIGLDGGVKLRQTDILSLEKLFSTIDGMPIRQSELDTDLIHVMG